MISPEKMSLEELSVMIDLLVPGRMTRLTTGKGFWFCWRGALVICTAEQAARFRAWCQRERRVRPVAERSEFLLLMQRRIQDHDLNIDHRWGCHTEFASVESMRAAMAAVRATLRRKRPSAQWTGYVRAWRDVVGP